MFKKKFFGSYLICFPNKTQSANQEGKSKQTNKDAVLPPAAAHRGLWCAPHHASVSSSEAASPCSHSRLPGQALPGAAQQRPTAAPRARPPAGRTDHGAGEGVICQREH